MANCKDCLHQCYMEATEEACNFFVDKTKYVEVVRCKDCKFFIHPTATDGLCELDGNHRIIWLNDDFCAYGERKDNV